MELKGRCIVIVANSCWNIYKFRLNLIERLLRSDNIIVVLAPLDEYISYKEKFPAVRHIAIKNLDRKAMNPLRDILLTFELSRIYKILKPDLIIHYTHKPNIYGGLAAFMTGKKSIAVITGLGYAFIRGGWIAGMARQLYRLSNRFHSRVIFENKDDMTLFVDKSLSRPDQSVSIKGCGVDTFYYSPIPEEKRKEHNSSMRFTFIGRLLYDKGIVEYVNAARLIKEKYPEIQFDVIGELDNANPSMIRKKILLEWIEEKLIRYHGFVEDPRPHIASSDCVVLPSYREGMPRVIMEAMSMAKPVISTLTPGCRETIDDGLNGFLVEAGDYRQLSDAMIRMSEMHPEEREKMGFAGRQKALEEFNSEKIANELFEIISQSYFCAK